jgi:multidrug efflux system membrane fusion protein
VRAQAATAAKEQKIPVELTIPGDSGHVYEGTIESFDNRIYTGTGTIRARARFANADGALVPGMFVSVRLASARDSNAILAPEAAVGSDQNKRFVFIVDGRNHADYRAVTLGEEVGGEQVVTSGLHDGDRIIVSGLQKVQPGALVDPEPVARDLASR